MATWMSPAPTNCDTCQIKITNKFYDAKTSNGPWACMCPSCQTLGPGIGRTGTGLGQEYTKQKSGEWLKTAG